MIELDGTTGDIAIYNTTSIVCKWRDPNPFPVNFFSVASGGTLEGYKNTTWIFGCKERKGALSRIYT